MSTREQQMAALAAGDVERMARLGELDRWFPTARSLNRAAEMARGKMNDEELYRCFPNGDRQPAMGVLLWAMMEAESPDPKQRRKWMVFRSLNHCRIPPPAEGVEDWLCRGRVLPQSRSRGGGSGDKAEEEESERGDIAAASLAALPSSVGQVAGPFPHSVGVSPAGNRFWLLAGDGSEDEGENPAPSLISDKGAKQKNAVAGIKTARQGGK